MINDNKSASLRRTILAGIAGNVMEWYDFAVYGYFVASIGKHFFPSTDELASVIAAFGAFAAGFLMRPIGGLIFGLVRRTHQDLAPAFYLMCAAALSLAVTLTMKEKAVATARAE